MCVTFWAPSTCAWTGRTRPGRCSRRRRTPTRPTITSWRWRGFGANGYIAEILAGNPDPAPLPIWHGSNFAEPELARDYVGQYGDLWNRTPHALAFLRWLHNHPRILIERAAVLECQGELLWEHDVSRRRPIVDRLLAVRDAIDDRLSDEIVRQRTDRSGRPRLPWMHPSAAVSR